MEYKSFTRRWGVACLMVSASLVSLSMTAQDFAIESIGSIKNPSGTWQVSITFNAPLDKNSAQLAANYSLSAGTIAASEVYENAGEHVPEAISQAVVLTVGGLEAATQYELTVNGVKDTAGNTLNSVSQTFRTTDLTWNNLADHKAQSRVVAVGEGGFDIESSGRAQWAMYDETTLVSRQISGDWDFKLQVADQDFSSQWARAGLMFREELNLTATREANDSTSRYMTAHANPVTKTANDTTPATRTLDENGGNNGFESNARITTGAETVGAGGGGPLTYPNTWVRLQRIGNTVTAFWNKSDGNSWTQLTSRTFDPPLADTVYVGPSFSPETANIGGGGFESHLFLAQMRNLTELPIISSAPANGTVFADAGGGLSIRIRSNTGAAQEDVSIAIQGADRTGQFTASGSDNDRTFTFNGGLLENVAYSISVSVTDAAGTSTTSAIRFDTFSQNNFTWEAEDFNFGGGMYFDDIVLCETVGGGPNCYFDRVGIEGIDEHDIDMGGPGDENIYRFGSSTAVSREENVGTEPTGDFLRQKYVTAGVRDYNVGWVAEGEWLNYTRTFPTGNFNIYARLARDGAVEFANELSKVSTPTATTASQTVEKLGTFRREGTGGWQSFAWIPLTNDNGGLVSVSLGGLATLRSTATLSGYNANFYMLVPASTVVESPTLVATWVDGKLNLTWEGDGFTLECKNSVTDATWTTVAAAGNSVSISAEGAAKFYRLRQ